VYEQRAFGFWLYLMSDAIIFSLLFATYAVMARNNAGGPTGNTLFSLPNAFAETMLLLFSSITFGLATLAMKSGEKERMPSWLLVTFLLGLICRPETASFTAWCGPAPVRPQRIPSAFSRWSAPTACT
jgi:cytochrome o ubiquinol oxidase subunit 3